MASLGHTVAMGGAISRAVLNSLVSNIPFSKNVSVITSRWNVLYVTTHA